MSYTLVQTGMDAFARDGGGFQDALPALPCPGILPSALEVMARGPSLRGT